MNFLDRYPKKKNPKIKLREYSTSGDRAKKSGQTDRQMTKQVIAFHNFGTTPKKTRILGPV
jgi:hypothetical protein